MIAETILFVKKIFFIWSFKLNVLYFFRLCIPKALLHTTSLKNIIGIPPDYSFRVDHTAALLKSDSLKNFEVKPGGQNFTSNDNPYKRRNGSEMPWGCKIKFFQPFFFRLGSFYAYFAIVFIFLRSSPYVLFFSLFGSLPAVFIKMTKSSRILRTICVGFNRYK